MRSSNHLFRKLGKEGNLRAADESCVGDRLVRGGFPVLRPALVGDFQCCLSSNSRRTRQFSQKHAAVGLSCPTVLPGTTAGRRAESYVRDLHTMKVFTPEEVCHSFCTPACFFRCTKLSELLFPNPINTTHVLLSAFPEDCHSRGSCGSDDSSFPNRVSHRTLRSKRTRSNEI